MCLRGHRNRSDEPLSFLQEFTERVRNWLLIMTTRDFTAGSGAKAVTPNDNADIYPDGRPCKIWVTGTGNIAMTCADGIDITVNSVPANSLVLGGVLLVKRVKSTGTAATGIYAIYQ